MDARAGESMYLYEKVSVQSKSTVMLMYVHKGDWIHELPSAQSNFLNVLSLGCLKNKKLLMVLDSLGP